ncbi:MAG: hypothetical protein WB662_01260 [Methyloceanibacter sp.]
MEIETLVIHWAQIVNPNLLNKHKRKAPRWSIRGVERPGRGRRPADAKAFCEFIGLG